MNDSLDVNKKTKIIVMSKETTNYKDGDKTTLRCVQFTLSVFGIGYHVRTVKNAVDGIIKNSLRTRTWILPFILITITTTDNPNGELGLDD